MKKNIVTNYIAYIKDNPEGYWFKRKLYGWGWTPATREGWLVTVLFIVAIGGVVGRAAVLDLPETAIPVHVILPALILSGLLFFVCYKKGEKPAWQWNGYTPKDDSQDFN